MLKSTSGSVAHIAAEVGYESEPAFNREFGVPPGKIPQSREISGDQQIKPPHNGETAPHREGMSVLSQCPG
jgi:AraC-like DNA-binding protein